MPTPSLNSIDRPRRPAALLLAALAVSTAASPALAEPTPQERSLAVALFQEGRKLMTEGNLAEACLKLAESQRLDPAGGTLLNVALCHDREGKIATAWVEYREALALARRDGRADREKAAAEAIQRLEASLSRLTIMVPEAARAPGLVVKLDGVALPSAAWGTKIPVDPGRREITAEAPGRRASATAVEVAPTASEPIVTVAPLDEAAPAVAPPPPAPAPKPAPPPIESPKPQAGSGQRALGYVIGAVGLAGIGVGAGFGVGAILKQGAANDRCATATCPPGPDSDEAIALNQDAKTFATVSNIAFGVGLAGLAAGVILVLTAPSQPEVSVGFAAHPGGGGASLRGAF